MMHYKNFALTEKKKLHALFALLVKMTGNTDFSSFNKSKVELIAFLKANSPYRVTEKADWSEHSNKPEFAGNMYAWAWCDDNELVQLVHDFLDIGAINTFIDGNELCCSFLFNNGRVVTLNIPVETPIEELYNYDKDLLALCEYLDFKYDIYQMPQNENLFISLFDQYENKFIKSYEAKTQIDEHTTVYKQVVYEDDCGEKNVDLIVLEELHTGQLLSNISIYEYDCDFLKQIVQFSNIYTNNIDIDNKVEVYNV